MAGGLFTVCAILTLGTFFNVGSLGTISYGLITAVVFAIIGIQWGFEFDNLPVTYTNNESGSDSSE